ncbi:hypothetical protein GCM10010174_40100 [Kutzneria viridogrisea]|uniref:Secreted protein n=2 Tax=Kutzneria TaxID=43356 RepID=A0ABR6BMJ7_9PSEU|nr:hypothetical protein [Kutzneria albida]AHH96658.1 putative secreted protein [Kutzneria albida DSM 43870]MBA8928121.1 hypothetical protein [Kutzneria viridogrisea]
MNKSARTALVLGAAALVLGGAFVSTSAAAGPAAPKAPAAVTSSWAKVSANGALLAGQGITGINKFGRGRYNLTTSGDISNCALNGTLNTNGGSDPGPGSSSILVGAVSGNTLFVRTATPSSTSPYTVDDDRPFSLSITCY